MPYVFPNLVATVPADTDLVSAGAGAIRNLTGALIERLDTLVVDVNANPVVLAPGASVSGAFTAANFIATTGTITTNTPLFSGTQTWNAGGVAFTAVNVNVTNTASAAGSFLLNLQVASSSKFSVDPTGAVIQAQSHTISAGGLTVTAGGITVSAGGAAITGNTTVTGALTSTSTLTVNAGGAGITGAVTISNGLTISASGLTVTAGGVTVNGGGATITGASSFSSTLSVGNTLTVTTGGLTVSAGGAAVTGASSFSSTLSVGSTLTITSGGLTVTAGGITVSAGNTTIPNIKTASGTLASLPNATATTLYNNLINSTLSATLICVQIPGNSSQNFIIQGIGGGLYAIQSLNSGVLSGSTSGNNFQVTQNLGGTVNNVTWIAIQLG